jgi:N-formylglutamate amidohydrolase
MYVEDLWSATPDVGGTLLFCEFPNTFIDVNRGEDDLDPAIIEGTWPTTLQPTAVTNRGLGLIKTLSRYGEPLQERRLTVDEAMDRIERYYRPYHAEIERIVTSLRGRFGRLTHLSCHCMSAIGAPTHADPGQARADFCIGDLFGTSSSEEFVEFLVAAIEGYGYSVSVNTPYQGYELNRRYGSPSGGIDSVMVEINKKLFMDTTTFRRTEDFAALKRDLDDLLERVATYAQARAEVAS